MFNLKNENLWWQSHKLEDWWQCWQNPYGTLNDNYAIWEESDHHHYLWLKDHILRHGILSKQSGWVISDLLGSFEEADNPYLYRLEDILKNVLPIYDTQFLFDTTFASNEGYVSQLRFYRFYKRKTYEVLKHNYPDDDAHLNTCYFVRTI